MTSCLLADLSDWLFRQVNKLQCLRVAASSLIYNTEQKTAGQKQQNCYFHSLTMKLRKLVLGVWILFPMTYNESVLGRDLLIVSITRSLKKAQTVSLISLLLKDMKNCETIL